MLKEVLVNNNLATEKTGLMVVYWGWFVTVAIVYCLILPTFQQHFSTLIMSSLGKLLIYSFLLFPFFYFPFICVVVWKNADKYTQRKIYSDLAKVSAIVGTMFLVGNGILIVGKLLIKLIFFSFITMTTLAAVNTAVVQPTMAINQIINKELSGVLGQEAELMTETIKENFFTYQYRLPNQDVKNIDKQNFYNTIRTSLIHTICNNLKGTLPQKFKFSFTYLDNKGTVITTIPISPSDCN